MRRDTRTKRWGLGAAATAAVLAISGLGPTVGLGQTVTIKKSLPDPGHGMEVLTRGPIHEAFAETITYDPEPGIVVTSAPPDPIEELPPDEKPDGVNVDWIPGYWAWDDEGGDFLWISGVWRALPPGREWVPGYWGRTARGFQWTPGYWADALATEIEYLPRPPMTVEVGPNIDPFSSGDVWIPGSWVWYEDRYVWRPGYWMNVQPDWVWIPAHYVWAGRGYVFVDGYWDYSIERRGVMFAPVRFDPTVKVYVQRGYSYRPTTVISLSVFDDHLFVRPRYNHYYFGDYYAVSYRDAGFYASFSYNSSRRGYDPIYTEIRWRHRQDPEWGRRVEANFSYRRDHEDARPRRTFAAQLSYTKDESRHRDRSFTLAATLDQYSKEKDVRVRFRRMDDNERQVVVRRSRDMKVFQGERQRVEIDASINKTSDRFSPIRMKARRSPFAGRQGDQVGRDDSPPERPRQWQARPKFKRMRGKDSDD